MANSDKLQDDGVHAGNWENPVPETDASSGRAPPWLATSIAEYRRVQRLLNVVRPIRATSFGGILVFLTLLTFLVKHSPSGQGALLAMSLCGLPICLAGWFIALSAQRRLSRAKHHIERRVYGAGMHLDDQGRALTDDPHPVLILDPTSERLPHMP